MPTLDDILTLPVIPIEDLATGDFIPVYDASTSSLKKFSAASFGNANAPVYIGTTSGDRLYVTGGGTDVIFFPDGEAIYHNFVINALGVTEINPVSGVNDVVLYLAGLPNCVTLDFSSIGITSLTGTQFENVTALKFNAASSNSSTFAIPQMAALESLDATNATSFNTFSFTAGSVPKLKTVTITGTTITAANVDSMLASLNLGNVNTVTGGYFDGNGVGTEENSTTKSFNTNAVVVFTRTAANKLTTVQPNLITSSLTGANGGPVALNVSAVSGTVTAFYVAVTANATTTLSFSGAAYQTRTLSGTLTYTASNTAVGRSIAVFVTQPAAAAHTVAWPATVTWAVSVPPTVPASTTTKVILTVTGISPNTFSGSYVENATIPSSSTSAELITTINNSAASNVLFTAAASGLSTGAVSAQSTFQIGNSAITQLVSKGWTISLGA